MPDFTAHHLLGEEVCRRLPENGKMAVMRAPCAFFWGLQGPDPLFYGGPFLARCGSQLHQKPPEQLLFLLSLQTAHAQGRRKELFTGYLLGFLCHYAMDARLHPYVYCTEQRLRASRPPAEWSALHGEIECRMDEALYRLKKKEPVTRFRPENYLPEPEALAAFCQLYRTLLFRLLDVRIRPGQIAGAFRRCLQINRLVYMLPARIGRPVLRGLEAAAGRAGIFSSHVKSGAERREDILNLKRAAWQNLSRPDINRFESVPELFEQAVGDALHLCGQFLPELERGKCLRLPPLPGFDAGNFKR